jgi:hypothetical protein
MAVPPVSGVCGVVAGDVVFRYIVAPEGVDVKVMLPVDGVYVPLNAAVPPLVKVLLVSVGVI